jgi:hypothetical protein
MKNIMSFDEFCKEYEKNEFKKYVSRLQVLSGIKPSSDEIIDKSYFIKVTFNFANSLYEHETYTFFQKTNNRYTYHPASTNPPVEAHYHVYPAKGKKELYAVNMSGSAHHKKNRQYHVPNKEADELRYIGVQIPVTNIIESLDFKDGNDKKLLLESVNENCFCIYIRIE